MALFSILFPRPAVYDTSAGRGMPASFADLNLDQVLKGVIRGREAADLAPFYYTPLHDVGDVHYRHEILRDLENPACAQAVRDFTGHMGTVRADLAYAAKLHYLHQRERWFLEAAALYGEAVQSLTDALAENEPASRGLQGLRAYLATYASSEGFVSLVRETENLFEGLASVTYDVHIKGPKVTVTRFEEEPDYSAAVAQTFAKFRQGEVKDYRAKFGEWTDMDHVEGEILERVAQLFPEVFQPLDHFCARRTEFIDDTVAAFDREIQFYLAWLDFIRPFAAAGLPFCYPCVSTASKEERIRDSFDLALANRLIPEGGKIVTNNFSLAGPERVIVVTGPNQGGKTTFARMFGQLHYLAGLGLVVPGREARLFLPDTVYTHFEKEEDLATLRGKFEDELVRIHDILQRATSESVLVMNESFASTTLNDALVVGKAVMERIVVKDLLCVYVTFVDELASLSERTVSMASTIVPENPAERTFKVVRKPADGLAYAAAIAEKYGLSYQSLRSRVTA